MVIRAVRRSWIAAVIAASAAGCGGSSSAAEPLIAPAASEPLTVTVVTRDPVAGETLPRAEVAAAPGAVAVSVIRSGGCAPIVTASISRQAGVIAVVGRVFANALADCAPIPRVTVYGGLIGSVASGQYRIDVFDANADETPRYVSSTNVTVPPRF